MREELIIRKQRDLIRNLKEVGQLYFKIRKGRNIATKQDVKDMAELVSIGEMLEAELKVLESLSPSPQPSAKDEAEKCWNCGETTLTCEKCGIVRISQPSATAERCPVCGGNGLVPNGFYMQTSGQWSTTSTTPETCRTCNGSGMVIIPLLPTDAAKPVAEREVPEEKCPPAPTSHI